VAASAPTDPPSSSSLNSQIFFSSAPHAISMLSVHALAVYQAVNGECTETATVTLSARAGWSITEETRSQVTISYNPKAYGYDLSITFPGETVSSWSSADEDQLLADLTAFYNDPNLSFSVSSHTDVAGVLVVVINVLGFSTSSSATTSHDSIASGGFHLGSSQFSSATATATEPGLTCGRGYSTIDSSDVCSDTDACLTATCTANGDSAAVCVDAVAPQVDWTCVCTLGWDETQDPGTCGRISCGSPATAAGYTIASGSSDFEATRTVTCATGYTGGASSIACGADGTWSTSSGCTIRNCGTPTAPTGYALGSGSTTYGSTYTMTCATGYSGTAVSLTCQSSESWTSTSGCTIVSCSSSPTQTGYTIASGSSTYGSTRTVTCGSGMSGTASAVTCSSSGSWTTSSGCSDTNGCASNACTSSGNSGATCSDVPAPGSGYSCTCTSGYTFNGNSCVTSDGRVLVKYAYTSSGTRGSAAQSYSWYEPSADYRVTITPAATDSLIKLRFMLPLNPGLGYCNHCCQGMRAFRMVNGVKSYSLTSTASSLGSRPLSGRAWRNVGYDGNDPAFLLWEMFDIPATTSAVTYGWEYKSDSRYGINSAIGYSAGDTDNWGFSADMIIQAEEHATAANAFNLRKPLIQFKYTAVDTRLTSDSTSFVEPSTTWRVTITPRAADSTIRVRFSIPNNPGNSYAANTIYTFRAFRMVGGTKYYTQITSAGQVYGSRNPIAGITIRPMGCDYNDPMYVEFDAIDEPGTTSAVTYGWEYKRETGGAGNLCFGYSCGDNTIWGFSTKVMVTAEEFQNPNNAGSFSSAHLQSKFTNTNTRVALDSTSFVELSTDYRVTIYPQSQTSVMKVSVTLPWSATSWAYNTIFSVRVFKTVNGGSKNYVLTTSGEVLGSRNRIAGITIRPQGYNLDDTLNAVFTVLDLHAASVGATVVYGFEWMREQNGAGASAFGYSGSDAWEYGFVTQILLSVDELVAS